MLLEPCWPCGLMSVICKGQWRAGRLAAAMGRPIFIDVLAGPIIAIGATFLSEHYGMPLMLFSPTGHRPL
jgi:hypothetical protein